jgi:hypothetical protein
LPLSVHGGEYLQLISALDGFTDLGAESDLPTYHPHPEGNPLAHLFEKQGNANSASTTFFCSPASRNHAVSAIGSCAAFSTGHSASLGEGISSWASDHYGLKATFEI